MKQYVQDFTQHLQTALKIGNASSFTNTNKTFSNVLICGLGGSGIGGTIIAQQLADKLSIPVIVNKDYSIPVFVNKNTLVIACSYSGNTEETLEMLEQAEHKHAEICAITSGGKLAAICQEKKYNYIKIPEGFPPRAAFGLSFPQLYFVFKQYNLISDNFIDDIKKSIDLINEHKKDIENNAKKVAEKLFNTIPVIYSAATFEGVAVRFRQQLNENAKMLCWHHALPEMNHNELVGWAGGNEQLSVVYFRNKSDYYRTQKRMEINKEIISKYTSNITEIWSEGATDLQRALYLIHFGDWVSVHLAELKQIDPIEVDVITYLKGELSKI